MKKSFLSCDWGTSAFRLRWVDLASGEILYELEDGCGVKHIHRCGWESAAAPASGREAFPACLTAKIRDLFSKIPKGLEDVECVAISGMASSSIGWKELPYAPLPFLASGETLIWEGLSIEIEPGRVLPAYLISGIASERDVMRGEESEIIGLVHGTRDCALIRGDRLLVLPGTHSKHVLMSDGIVTDFATHLTGELFEVLSKHSILAESTEMPQPGWTDEESCRTSFREGVLEGASHGVSAGFFQTRSRSILKGASKRSNGLFLLGLLAGLEMSAPDVRRAESLILAGGEHLQAAYRLALRTLSPEKEVRAVPAPAARNASTLGHLYLLRSGMLHG